MRFHCRIALFAVVLLTLAIHAGAEGVIRYAGATTLQRSFMPEISRLFTDATAIKVHIEGGNTNPGLRALEGGEVDVAGAGRFLTDAEKERGLVEHFLGWDLLAVVVHVQNPLESLSMDQLQGIFSGRITDWSEVGGRPGAIVVVTSPRGSGMRSAVEQLVLAGDELLSREVVSAIVAEADRQVSLFATGITALSHSMLDVDGVKTLKVDGFEPTAANVAAGRYPLAKPLTLVTRGEPQGDLARLMAVVQSDQGRAVLNKSFFSSE